MIAGHELIRWGMEALSASPILSPTTELWHQSEFRQTHWKNKLWHSYNDFLSERFGEKVYKITVSAGFTCPTRDGTKGSQGCAFCDERGSASFYSAGHAAMAIQEQIRSSMPGIRRRFHAQKFLAYFQSFTNTYGPLNYLTQVYDSALKIDDVVGLVIGTRPDCIPLDVLLLLNRYASNRFLSLELGLQSFREESLLFYERGHSVVEGIEGITRALKFPQLNVAVHLMFGAPGETIEDVVHAAHEINRLKPSGVKIHQLMILKNTILAERYLKNPWPLLSMEEYTEWVIAFLENLDPSIHVERTHALSSHPDELVGPAWSAERFAPMIRLKQTMQMRDSYHGKFFG